MVHWPKLKFPPVNLLTIGRKMTDEETIERIEAERQRLYDNYDFQGAAELDERLAFWEKADRSIKSKTDKENAKIENDLTIKFKSGGNHATF